MFQIKLRDNDTAFTTSNLQVSANEQVLMFKDIQGNTVFLPWSSVSFWLELPRSEQSSPKPKEQEAEGPKEKEEKETKPDAGKGTKHGAK